LEKEPMPLTTNFDIMVTITAQPLNFE
jgi:hypothetical protein